MTYEEWENLTEREQEEVPDEELPVIPPEMLRNGLTASRLIRKDEVLGWRSTQQIGEKISTDWFPMYKVKLVQNREIWYKFDPLFGTYKPNLTGLEASMEDEPIGSYGMRWMHFMEEQHPHLVTILRFRNQFLTVARSVDKRAWDYRELLDKQFEKANPRPESEYEQILAWEKTREFYTDGAVMREIVLVPVTTP